MAARRKKRRPRRENLRALFEVLRDNCLSIALFGLFGITLCLHAVAAWYQQNDLTWLF
jgi:hypothetical protein